MRKSLSLIYLLLILISMTKANGAIDSYEINDINNAFEFKQGI